MEGRKLLHYQVLKKLGEGGMGVVYLARDEKLGRLVAIKVLPNAGAVDGAARARFHREARAASALNHPNIITIHEIASVDDTEMIVMEHVTGKTLGEVIGGKALPFDHVFAYAHQLVDALTRAHAARVIHRDLKPSNIMVGDDGRLKVLDFGLAKMQEPPAASTDETALGAAPLTAAHVVMGTAAYMSPEQATGQPVDERSDIFSLGVVLYEMTSGYRPFQGQTGGEILGKLLGQDPAPIERLRPETPAALAELLRRALAKNRDDRFGSMAELGGALRVAEAELTSGAQDPIDAGEALTVSDAAPTAISWRPTRRVAAIALVVVLSVVGIAGWPQLARFFAPATTGMANRTGPSSTAYEHYEAGRSLLIRHDQIGNVDKAIAEFDEGVRKDGNYAPAYAGLANAYHQKNLSNPDPQWVRSAHDAASTAVTLNPDLAVARVSLGRVLTSEGKFDDAETELLRAVDLNPQDADAHMWLGTLYQATLEATKAETEFRQAVALASATAWQPLAELGQFLYRAARYDEAATAWAQSAAMVKDNATLHRQLGAAYYALDRLDDAANEFQLALQIQPAARLYNNLGTLRFFQGKYAEAVPAFEKAVEMAANRSLYWGGLGDAYRWAPGMRDKSIEPYTRAAQLVREDLSVTPDDPELRSQLALYLVKSGDTDAALRELATVEQGEARSASMWFRALVIYELAGERPRALQALREALQAGYSPVEIRTEPELVNLRTDPEFHTILAGGK